MTIDYLSLDYCIVYAFLFITLMLGLRAGRNVKDVQDYAVANKSFRTLALILTFIATDVGANQIMWGAETGFSQGIILAFIYLGIILSYAILGFIIGPRVIQFSRCITLGDIMRSLYGHHVSILISMLGLIVVVFLISAELYALGSVCETILGIKAAWGIGLGGIFFAVYTTYGGIRSVAATDVWQFIVMAVGIPVVAYLALGEAGGMEAIATQVPADKWLVWEHDKFYYYLTLFFTWTFVPLGVSSPIIIQRMLMAQKAQQLKDQFLVSGIFFSVLQWVFALIGLSALVLYPNIEAKQVVGHLVHNLLPVGIKGITMAALVGVSMSTLDSQLHIAGLTLVHDVIKPMYDLRKIEIQELTWIRWATVLVSMLAISLAISAQSATQLHLVTFSIQAPIMVFPILAGILGLRVDARSFYIALSTTLAALVATNLYLPAEHGHFAILIHVAVNAVTFMSVHIAQHGGIAIVDRRSGQHEPPQEV